MKQRDYVFSKLKKYISNGNEAHAWFGSVPLFKSDVFNLKNCTNYRIDKEHHQKYKTIWVIEDDIFSLYSKSWILLIDEALRLLSESGFLIIRSSDNEHGTLFSLKSFLYRNKNIHVELLEQINVNESTISILKISRINIHYYNDKKWSIGILSNGNKNENVIALVEKLLNINTGLEIEFIIAGPLIDKLLGIDNVHFICEKMDTLPRISEKKNLIIKTAKNANVALFHDRYQVNDDFFNGFEHYGYDFDFLTIRQLYQSGNEFPSYLMFSENKKKWQRPIVISKYDEVSPSSFLNGGLLIVKKHSALEVNFNNLLLHNEAEDVEFSMQLLMNGIAPRINTMSSAMTLGIDESYTSSFIFIKEDGRCKFKKYIFKLWLKLPAKLKNRIKKYNNYEKIKNIIIN